MNNGIKLLHLFLLDSIHDGQYSYCVKSYSFDYFHSDIYFQKIGALKVTYIFSFITYFVSTRATRKKLNIV